MTPSVSLTYFEIPTVWLESPLDFKHFFCLGWTFVAEAAFSVRPVHFPCSDSCFSIHNIDGVQF